MAVSGRSGVRLGVDFDDLRVIENAIESDVYIAFMFKWPLPGRYTFQLVNASSAEKPTAANTTEIPFTAS